MSDFFELFTYTFVIRAFVVGIMVSLCAAVLGVTLVLKKYSMIGDGLSHVGFGAVSVALALNITPMYIAVPVMFLSAFLLLRMRENKRGDALIAVISSSSIAVGVTAAALSGGMSTDVYSYMFGSILAVTRLEVILASVLCITVLITFILCYNRIFAFTFDESFASASGIKTRVLSILLAMLTAVTVVIGMRVMGAMLISGLIVFPAVSAMRLFKSFKGVIISAGVIAVTAVTAGIVMSCLFTYIPAGAGIVLANLVILIISSVLAKILKR